MSKARELADVIGTQGTTEQVLSGRRNVFYNGAMQVAQRGTSITSTGTSMDYTLDRWHTRNNSGGTTITTQSTDAPEGFQYSMRTVREVGEDVVYYRIQQPLETSDIIPLRGKEVTLSFYIKADSGCTNLNDLNVWLYAGNGTERARGTTDYDNETNVIADSLSITTSWQRVTYTGTVPTDASQMCLNILWLASGTAPANDGFFITGVQLELGSVATPFEHRSYGEELALCQRYYFTTWPEGYAIGSDVTSTGSLGVCMPANGSKIVAGGIGLPTTMRAKPSVTVMSPTGATGYYYERYNSTNYGYSSGAIYASNSYVGLNEYDGAADANRECFVHIFCDAEL